MQRNRPRSLELYAENPNVIVDLYRMILKYYDGDKWIEEEITEVKIKALLEPQILVISTLIVDEQLNGNGYGPNRGYHIMLPKIKIVTF